MFRTAALYIAAAWGVLQVADLAFPGLGVPDEAIRFVWIALFMGFPLALFFGWRYELTVDGVELTPSNEKIDSADLALQRTDYAILGVLLLVLASIVYQAVTSIREVGQLNGAAAIDEAPHPYSIAVLPLRNLSGDAAEDFFVDGMHEALIGNLARIDGLRVISRTSANVYRNVAKPLVEIGRELGVARIVEGSVYRSGDTVRISVQVLDALLDQHLWAEEYERNIVDVLSLQSEMAKAIAGKVEGLVISAHPSRWMNSKPVNALAYEAYLKGRFHWYKFTAGDLDLSISYFRQALAVDPEYALAHVGLADALATRAHMGLLPSVKAYPEATRLVQRALELDPSLAEAHDLLARINFAYEWDWVAAEQGFQRAIELNPGFPDVRVVYSQLLGLSGYWSRSMNEVEQALVFDPLNTWFKLERAQRLAWQGDTTAGLHAVATLAASNPDWPEVHRVLWGLAFVAGDEAAALAAATTYYVLIGETALAAAIREQGSDARYIDRMLSLAKALQTQTVRPYVDPVEMAEIYAHAGVADQVFRFLSEALRGRESRLVYVLAYPVFVSYRDDPRFLDIKRKMGLAPLDQQH